MDKFFFLDYKLKQNSVKKDELVQYSYPIITTF